MPEERELPLLNLFEVETDDGIKHMVGLVDAVRAGAEGVPTRSIVGRFTPGPDGSFNIETFGVNPEFVAAFTDFMNGDPSRSDEVVAQAKSIPSQWLYIVDPRD